MVATLNASVPLAVSTAVVIPLSRHAGTTACTAPLSAVCCHSAVWGLLQLACLMAQDKQNVLWNFLTNQLHHELEILWPQFAPCWLLLSDVMSTHREGALHRQMDPAATIHH